MLADPDLRGALIDALKASAKCGRFCSSGAKREEDHYIVHHNGTGSRDTDVQTVHSTTALAANQEQFSRSLSNWLSGLHAGVKLDLNGSK